jgi:ATP-binding cassette, subfamily F, member 3
MSRLLIQFSHLFYSNARLEDLSLSVNQGDVFALTGENGAGKTTLLRLLNGSLQADRGEFTRSPHLTTGFLPQEVFSNLCVRDFLEEGLLHALEEEMAACLEKSLEEWALLHEKYEQLGGYRKVPVEKVLHGLKLDVSLMDRPMSELSSGQRVRIALARALIDNPDLLLLDEPTNHLDSEVLAWLQATLRAREGAAIIVSHNRKFLNAACNRLIELKKGKLTCYGGSYDFYLEEQKRQLEQKIREFQEQEEEIAALKQKIKAITFSKKKPAPPKDRNFMAYDRRGEHHQRSLQRTLNDLKARLSELETNRLENPKPLSIKGLRFAVNPLPVPVAVEVVDLAKSFGDKALFSGLNRRLSRGDRIVLTGPNGSGKTTLLRCLMGLLEPDSGEIRISRQAKIGYLDQEGELLPMDQTPLSYFEERFHLPEEGLRRELHMAAIGGAELLMRPFSTLSAGQRKRFCLLSLILEKPNVLLLDEPTNHIDLMTLEAFETALLNFEGAILAVSHDQTFSEKIATGYWAFSV